MRKIDTPVALAAITLAAATATYAQVGAVPSWKAWNDAVPTFRISENIRYVGAAEVSSFLITTNAGHVIIDSGFIETVPRIVASLKEAGVDPRDIKYILSSHAHGDHVGGLAELKRVTGAQVIASAADAELMARGGKRDPMFGDELAYEPVKADRLIADGEVLDIGGVKLKANITPGHTKGCTTWTMTTRIEGRDFPAVFVCSLSAPGYKLVGNKAYPDVVADYRSTFKRMAALECQLFLAPHASMFAMDEKRKRLAAGDAKAFVDPEGCKRFIQESRAKFETELSKQQRGKQG